MPQFVIIARDGADAQAQERRQAARPAHLQSCRSLLEKGNLLHASALLDETGQFMVGSVMTMEFSSQLELQAWLSEEPYVLGQVWEQIEIIPCAVSALFLKAKAIPG